MDVSVPLNVLPRLLSARNLKSTPGSLESSQEEVPKIDDSSGAIDTIITPKSPQSPKSRKTPESPQSPQSPQSQKILGPSHKSSREYRFVCGFILGFLTATGIGGIVYIVHSWQPLRVEFDKDPLNMRS
jgi:hypothetical protein